MKKSLEMKTVISLFIVSGMFLLSSCKKEDNGNPSDNGVLEIAPFEISGQMKKLVFYRNWTNTDIDPYYSFEDYDLGSGNIKLTSLGNELLAEGNVASGGELTLSFISSFPTSDFHLHRFLYHTGESELITPKDLRTSYFYVVAGLGTEFIPDGGGEIKQINVEKLPYLIDGLSDFHYTQYALICAEEPGEIKGVKDDGREYNMILKKGWNVVRISGIVNQNENKKYETVESIPADAFFHYGSETVNL